MSSLRSIVDELAVEDLARLEDRQLEDDLVEIDLQIVRLTAQRSRRLAEIDRRGSYKDSGYLSTTSWLRDRCGISARESAKRTHRARALTHMPDTSDAFRRGEIGVSTVNQLVAARRAHPHAFAGDEQTLIEAVKPLNPRDTFRTIEYWRQAQDVGEGAADRRFQRRRLDVSSTLEGMVRIDGEIHPEGGEAVIIALNALAETTDPTDDRTTQQRRADALVDLCGDYLDRGSAPIVGGEKPHVTLTVSLEALEKRAGKPCELDETGVITAEAARRLACDSSISRIITQGASEPLDVGRRTRTISSALRRALVVRDGGCVIQGCDRPPRWCDAHHIQHWVDGGETSLANTELLCRRHHTMEHEGQNLPRKARAP